MYAACLHKGNIISDVVVGRKFQPGSGNISWKDAHLACALMVTYLLECVFIQVEGNMPTPKTFDDSESIQFNYLSERCTMYEQYEEV